MYRHALRIRRELRLGEGSFDWLAAEASEVMAYQNGDVQVWHNFGQQNAKLPEGYEVIATSAPNSGNLLPNQTVWLKRI